MSAMPAPKAAAANRKAAVEALAARQSKEDKERRKEVCFGTVKFIHL